MFLTLAMLLVLAGASHAIGVSSAQVNSIDTFIASHYPPLDPGASVIISRGEEVILRRGYGVSSTETMAPTQPATSFWLGSISKQFAAMAMLILVQDGSVRLSDPITKFFPEFPRFFSHISIENLLTHTSGLQNYSSFPELEDKERRSVANILAAIRDHSLSFNPGQGWGYSDSNYYLIGLVIERVTRSTYCDFIEARLFSPLGMTQTRCAPVGEAPANLSTGYLRGARGPLAASTPDSKFYSAAGAIISTVDDLSLWHRALVADRIVGKSLQQRAFQQAKLDSGEATIYGYGWVVHDINGLRVLEHGGLIGGFENHILWIPSEDIFVAILSNHRGKSPNPDTLATRIALSLSSLQIPLENRDPEPPFSSAAAGLYQMEGRSFEISPSELGLIFRRVGKGDTFRVVQLTSEILALEDTLTLVSFLPTKDGTIWAFSIKAKYGGERVAVRIRPAGDGRNPRVARCGPYDASALRLDAGVPRALDWR